jgi:hypothetical protein
MEPGRVPLKRKPFEARLPAFVEDEPVGLGDAIKRATTRVGIRPCGGCERRAQWLNSWLTFTRRH